MSRNAGEFEIKLRELLTNYKKAQEGLRANRHRFTQDSTAIPAGVGDALLTENLEAHARTYLVDGIFAALGWTMVLGQDPVGQLLIEQPIRGQSASTVKYMDYLGVEGNTDRPLLIIETKRPGARLPHYDGRPPMYETAGAYADLLAKGLSDPERLSADWPEWIDQVGGYARAVFARCQEWPRRVVITNGEWMIIFEDAASAFGTAEQVDPNGIMVLPRLSPAHETAGLVFQSIAYGQLVSNTEFRTPAELHFYLHAAAVDGVLHGLRVFAGKKSGHRTIEPTIYVTPLLFLRTVRGAWFKVHEESADHEFEIPYNKEGLVAHLKHVDRAASALLINVNHHLSAQMVPTEPVLSSVRFSRCLQPVERFSLTLPPRDALNFGAFSKMQWGLMAGTGVHHRTAATMSGDRVASESLSDEGPPPFVERRIRSMTRVDFEPLQMTVPLREESPGFSRRPEPRSPIAR